MNIYNTRFFPYVFLALFCFLSFANNAISSREDFEKAVAPLRTKTACTTGDLKETLRMPGVLEWIQRPFQRENFDGQGPIDCAENESWFYSALAEAEIVETSRQHINGAGAGKEQTFYCSGTDPYGYFDEELETLRMTLYATEHQDIYGIRNIAIKLQLPQLRCGPSIECVQSYFKRPVKSRFWVAPNDKDDHATLIFSILSEDLQTVLASVLINSAGKEAEAGQPDDYYKYLNIRWCQKNPCAASAQQWAKDKGLSTVFSFEPTFDEKLKLVRYERCLIDGSHTIQTAPDDQNCSYYVMNFSAGIAAMVQNEEIATRLCALAQGYYETGEDKDGQIAEICKMRIKEFLPQYYNGDGTPRSDEEIKWYHMKQRWDLSGRAYAKALAD